MTWKWKSLSHVWLFVTPWTIQSMEFSSQNTGVSSLSLLQGIFPTQGLNPSLPHYQQILYQLSHKGSPTILEWVAYPFSSQSSRLRNQTRVSHTTGRFFTNWAIKEAHLWLTGEEITIIGLYYFLTPTMRKIWIKKENIGIFLLSVNILENAIL